MFLSVSFASSLQGNGENNNRNSRRHLLKSGTECVTYLRITDVADGPDEEAWTCEFDYDDAKQFGGARMVDIDGLTMGGMKKRHAVSGGTVLRLGSSSYVETEIVDDLSFKNVFMRGSGSEVDRMTGPPVLHISEDDDFEIEEMDEVTDSRHSKYRRRMREERRRLAQSTGDLKTLVIRVVDKDGKAASTPEKLDDDIFKDDVSLKTQFSKCSHNNVNIVPAEKDGFSATVGTEYNGIINVEIDTKASQTNSYNMVNTAVALAESDLGGNLNDNFDLVMICQPPGTYKGSSDNTGWLAYAWIDYHISVYNDYWCNSVSAQMHEVGHNLGLLHSGKKGGVEYADTSGMMGYSYNYDDIPAMCFNSAKSYQLGWYPEQMLSINPLALPGGSQQYTLNGVVDYGDSDGYVTIRLEYEGDKQDGIDYYVGFNRQTGFNFQTQTGGNQVQIVEKVSDYGLRDGPGQSWLLESLGAGEQFEWDIGGTTVNLKVDSISGKDAIVTLTGGAEVCVDDPTFRYKGDERKTCAWVGKKDTRRTTLCARNGVRENCPETCDNCNPAPPAPSCADDPTFRYRGDDWKTCYWVGKRETRRTTLCASDGVRSNCPETCDNCP
jgi:hypothetical protein